MLVLFQLEHICGAECVCVSERVCVCECVCVCVCVISPLWLVSLLVHEAGSDLLINNFLFPRQTSCRVSAGPPETGHGGHVHHD